MEAEKRKLIKFSNYSLCVTLPKWILKKLLWDKGDEVDIEVDEENQKLIIFKGKDSNSKNKENILRW